MINNRMIQSLVNEELNLNLQVESPVTKAVNLRLVRNTLLDVLRNRKVTGPYVFCDDQGRPHTPYKLSMAFKRACTTAGVENLRWHDLRHDFATLMLRKTKNLVDVQHALGHKDSRMSLRYTHLLPDDLKEAFGAIDNAGTASILSQIYHNGEPEEGLRAATS